MQVCNYNSCVFSQLQLVMVVRKIIKYVILEKNGDTANSIFCIPRLDAFYMNSRNANEHASETRFSKWITARNLLELANFLQKQGKWP